MLNATDEQVRLHTAPDETPHACAYAHACQTCVTLVYRTDCFKKSATSLYSCVGMAVMWYQWVEQQLRAWQKVGQWRCNPFISTCIHTCVHTYMHTCTCTHAWDVCARTLSLLPNTKETGSHASTLNHTSMRIGMHACAHTHTHKHTYTHICIHMIINAHMHECSHMDSHICACIYTHVCLYMCIRHLDFIELGIRSSVYTWLHVLTPIHIHAYIYIHKQAHTHISICIDTQTVIQTCTYIRSWIHTYACAFIWAYMYVYTNMYTGYVLDLGWKSAWVLLESCLFFWCVSGMCVRCWELLENCLTYVWVVNEMLLRCAWDWLYIHI